MAATASLVTEAGVNTAHHEGLSAFYRAEYPRLVRALTLYCGDRELGAELAQESMARAWCNWEQVARLDSPGGWVHRVGINLANSSFRRERLRRRTAPPAPEREEDVGTAMAVRAAVAALPRRQRTAIVLRYFADLPIEEVASLMRCRPGTVRALTAQAVAGLRKTAVLHDLEEDEQ